MIYLIFNRLSDDDMKQLLDIHQKDIRGLCAKLKEDHLLKEYVNYISFLSIFHLFRFKKKLLIFIIIFFFVNILTEKNIYMFFFFTSF